MSIAFLFPGQGAQTPGFLHRLPDHKPVTAALEEASHVLGQDVFELDSEAALASTVAVQLTCVIAGVAIARAIGTRGVEPQAVAGLSVGAFTAAVVCGALQFADALRLVRLRGAMMERVYPHGYGLAAIVGLDERSISTLVEQVSTPEAPVYLANLNAPTQFVIAGAEAGLQAALGRARSAGARKAERMAVTVPSHCRLLEPVAVELERAMADVVVAEPRIPYVTNRRARVTRDRDVIRDDLARNVMYAVRWHDATTVLFELGVRLFIEMPPGHTLTGLATAAFPDARVVAAEDARLETIAILAERERRLDEAHY
ncbi:MAG: malonate decarboxylase subunit epsilon [Planctomycetaceae bacterium]|nr:malonate decarboxylase subunit epsilon [Planctomycetaceae bacterium]